MYCEECGNKLEPGSEFCGTCGAKVNLSVQDQEEPITTLKDNPNDMNETPKKKTPKWPFVALVSAVAIMIATIIAVVVGVVIFMFPLDVTFSDGNQEMVTTEGSFEDFAVDIKANQPIRSVSYVLTSAESEEEVKYTEVECEGSLFKKAFVLEELAIPPGESELRIKVDTWFGSDNHSMELKFDMGSTAAPDADSYIEVEEGTYLVSNELLIVFESDMSESDIEALIAKYNGETVGQIYYLNQYQVRFTGKGETFINEIKAKVEAEQGVEAVYYNVALDISMEVYPNDSKYDEWNTENPSGNNWGLECIDAPGAWEYQEEMSVVKVGVVDSALQYTHSDLKIDKNRTSILATNDFSTQKSLKDYYDEYVDYHECINDEDEICVFCSQKDHGTHVTGIVGALANNGHGVAGVNWNTEIYFTTAWYYSIPQEGQLSMTSSLSGINYSISRMVMSGCRVVNLSFGDTEPSEVSAYEENLTASYDYMIEKLEDSGYDFLIVKSAGNENDDASRYMINRIMTSGEHAAAHTIIVGAVSNASSITNRLAAWMADTEKIYNLANYSNYGALVDVAAPGTDIYSTVSGNSYRNMDGTSMAAPMVSGVASLVYSVNPNLTYDIVKTVVCCTGNKYCAKDGEVYAIVNAKNAVEWVREHANKVPELELPTVGFVTGLIQDAVTMELIEDAAVLLTNDETGATYESVVERGTYYCYLEPGTYTIQFAAENYITETVYGVEIVEDIVNYNVLLNMVPDEEKQGVAAGRIVDAFDASSIPNATLAVYSGINQTSGTPVTTIRSDAMGYYKLNLEPGNYTVYASASGYTSSATTITVVADQTRNNQDCTLTPILNEGEIRVVLTWGQYPSDLDSHMVGPAPDGNFHTYFGNQNYYYGMTLYDNLDVDDTTSYGPETTSVYVGLDGTYTFYVHNYSDRESGTSSSMATSGAQVKLYMAGMEKPIVYNVPNQPGTLWKVFSVNNGQVTPINTMSFHTNPDTIGR